MMQTKKSPKGKLPKLISEAQQMYQTEPVTAALMLHESIRSFEGVAISANHESSHELGPTHQENMLKTAFWSMRIMGEDANAGIAPPPDEWEMNISVAESIARMLEGADDAT